MSLGARLKKSHASGGEHHGDTFGGTAHLEVRFTSFALLLREPAPLCYCMRIQERIRSNRRRAGASIFAHRFEGE